MAMTLEPLSNEMMGMPAKNRAILAKKLRDSLESGQDPAEEEALLWAREADRRFQEIAAGSALTRPADVVMRSARDRFKG